MTNCKVTNENSYGSPLFCTVNNGRLWQNKNCHDYDIALEFEW